MDSLTRPLERVVEAIEHFVRTPRLRMLYVTTSALLRESVLQHICAAELYDFNKTPFFVIEAPSVPNESGWDLRVDELRTDWEILAERDPNKALPAVWAVERSSHPAARFGLELGRALASVRGEMDGLTIVFAPLLLTSPAPFVEGVMALVAERGLRSARFVVVESETTCLREHVTKLGTMADVVDACVSEAQLAAEATARLEAIKSAPMGMIGPRVMGAAGPDVVPPRRPGQAAPLTPVEAAERAAQLGIPAAYLQPEILQKLNILLMSAALAVKDGKPADGVRYQREARDHCFEHRMYKEGVVNELILGSYFLQAGINDKAVEIFTDARRHAEEHGLGDQAVQAQMAKAACLFVLKRVDDAAAAYADAGAIGVRLTSPVLAIESYRMCGQLLIARGKLEQAAAAFRRALEVAAASPDDAKMSSAPEAARALAEACRKRGLVAQADSLDAQASALESAALEQAAGPANAEPTT